MLYYDQWAEGESNPIKKFKTGKQTAERLSFCRLLRSIIEDSTRSVLPDYARAGRDFLRLRISLAENLTL
jgi:hypothetical protein